MKTRQAISARRSAVLRFRSLTLIAASALVACSSGPSETQKRQAMLVTACDNGQQSACVELRNDYTREGTQLPTPFHFLP